ncbi:hypothetical protein FI667_g493, partial [Globisporangium splendens]
MGKKKSSAKQKAADSSSHGIASLFLDMQSKSAQWYDKEREGIALIEGFQTALTACRDELQPMDGATSGSMRAGNGGHTKNAMASFAGLGGNSQMDPLLAEDLFAQVKALKQDFEELLEDMYDLHRKARTVVSDDVVPVVVLTSSTDDVDKAGATLTPIDYFQFIGQELAAYEAEYQHVEALLEMMSFEISTDQLRTLVISWSTSPFLNPEQSREFRKRHDLVHNN